MIVICAFTYDTEAKRAGWTGNVPINQGLSILQEIAIADAVAKAKGERYEASGNPGGAGGVDDKPGAGGA